MSIFTRSAALLGSASVCALALASASLAQLPLEQGDDLPPENPAFDGAGVDLATGGFSLPSPSVSVGEPGNGGLSWSAIHSGSGWRHSIMGGVVDVSATEKLVTLFDGTETFEQVSGAWVSSHKRGGSLSFDAAASQWVYTSAAGVVVRYHEVDSPALPVFGYDAGYVDTVTFPDGRVMTYHYDDEAVVFTGSVTGQYYRLQSVTTNQGYQLHFEYAVNAVANPADLTDWARLTKVQAINNAAEYCAPLAFTCSMSMSWPRLAINEPDATTRVFVNNLNEQTRFTFDAQGRVIGARSAGQASDNLTIAYHSSGEVSQVDRAGYAQFYIFTVNSGLRIANIYNPNLTYSVVQSDAATGQILAAIDTRGERTEFDYDSYERLTLVTRPEGDATEYAYDDRGNVTTITAKAKPGSGLADLVTTMAFPASCTNPVTCNQPTAMTSPAGETTNFTYDATHGGVLTVTGPAPASGADRPQTRMSYASHHAWALDGSGSAVQLAGPITLADAVSACRTGVAPSCTGTAEERVISFTYGAPGAANNLQLTEMREALGDGSIQADTTFSYDHRGDVRFINGPLSGPNDRISVRYDALRRVVGEIGPDPDGAGGRDNAAIRYSYDADGRLTLAEIGSTPGQNGPAWAAFAVESRRASEFDASGRLTEARTESAGGTIHALTQYAYDINGRPDCVAVRMNPATFASPPGDACTLATAGAFGPDRIIGFGYDDDGRLLTRTVAVGTPIEAVEATMSYSDNGALSTFADGNGNLTTWVRDGFDRVVELRHPHPTLTGQSHASDRERYTYSADGRLASVRRRGGGLFSYTYDDAGRLSEINAPGSAWDVSFTHDHFGQTLSASLPGHTVVRTFNALGDLLSETSPEGSVSYAYDVAGRRTQMSWPDGFFVDYDLDFAGLVTAIRENGASSGPGVLAQFDYDDQGRRTRLDRGNGSASVYGYDAIGRLASLTQDLAGTGHDVTSGFSYNPAHQISARTLSNDDYVYDAHIALDQDADYNGLNQMTDVLGGTFSLSHDSDGNVTDDVGYTYTYDPAGRLETASNGLNLDYDPLGRLSDEDGPTRQRDHQYDGWDRIASYTNAGALSERYIHGPGIDEPLVQYTGLDGSSPSREWLHADERGSIVAHSDDAGARSALMAYDEFGMPAAAYPHIWQTTGQAKLDHPWLHHYKTRAFNNQMQAFMQPDTIGLAGGPNLYAYLGGDGVNNRDPWGMSERPRCEDDPDCIVVTGWRFSSVSFGGIGSLNAMLFRLSFQHMERENPEPEPCESFDPEEYSASLQNALDDATSPHDSHRSAERIDINPARNNQDVFGRVSTHNRRNARVASLDGISSRYVIMGSFARGEFRGSRVGLLGDGRVAGPGFGNRFALVYYGPTFPARQSLRQDAGNWRADNIYRYKDGLLHPLYNSEQGACDASG